MPHSRLNPLWLSTFRSVVETRNFTETAKQLFMTQPGVSQHIRKLEQACDCQLLDRRDRSLELTHQGEAVYRYALQLQQKEQQLLSSLQADDPYRGDIVCACSGSQALTLYPQLLTVQQQHLLLNIHLEVAPNHSILSGILDARIDFGIVTHFNDDHRYQADVLAAEELCLLLPANNEKQPLNLATLQQLGLIDHPDAYHHLSLYFSGCGETDLQNISPDFLPKRGHINQLSQILLPVSQGIGFTVLPRSAVEAFPEKNKLQIYQPRNAVNQPRHLLKKRHRQLPARSQRLYGLIQKWINQ